MLSIMLDSSKLIIANIINRVFPSRRKKKLPTKQQVGILKWTIVSVWLGSGRHLAKVEDELHKGEAEIQK